MPDSLEEQLRTFADSVVSMVKGLIGPSVRAIITQNALIEFLNQTGQLDRAAFQAFYESFEREHVGPVRRELLDSVLHELYLLRPEPPSS